MKIEQRGNVVIILAVLVAVVVGAWQFSEYKSRQKREEVQRVEAEMARREAIRQKVEREELERRLEMENAEKDALTAAFQKVDDLALRWEDARRVAGVTGRIALSGPVATLQSIRREVDALTVPPCLDDGIIALKRSMDTTIDGYVHFMLNRGEGTNRLAGSLLDQASDDFDVFKKYRQGCTPSA